MTNEGIARAEKPAPKIAVGPVIVVFLGLAFAILAFALWATTPTSTPEPTSSPSSSESASATPTPTPIVSTSATTVTVDKLTESTTATIPAPDPTVSPSPTPTATPGAGQVATSTETTTTTTTSTSTPTPTPSPTPTATPYPTKAFGLSWDSFWTDGLLPLAGALTFATGAALALFLVARLFIELPVIRRRQSSGSERKMLGWFGWPLMLGSPVAIALLGAGTAKPTTETPDGREFNLLVLLCLIGMGVMGALAVALWLAARLRLDISVTAAKEPIAGEALQRSDVISQVRMLIGPSKGVEVPSGMNLTALTTSLGELSSNVIMKGIQTVVLFVTGVVPFKVEVTQHSPAEASVVITRHGRVQEERRVSLWRAPYATLDAITNVVKPHSDSADQSETSPQKPPLAEPSTAEKQSTDGATTDAATPLPRDLLATAVAAVIMMELRKTDTYDFDRALMGATLPESVALRAMAVKWFSQPATPLTDSTTELKKASDARLVLEKATSVDPFNRAARWTLDWVNHRDACTLAEIEPYIDLLTKRLKARHAELGGSSAYDDTFYSTTLMTLAAMTRNAAALQDPRLPDYRKRLTSARNLLDTWLREVAPTADNRVRRARAKIDLLAIDAALGTPQPHHAVLGDRAVFESPELAYSFACYLTRWAKERFTNKEVVRLFDRADQVSVQQKFAPRDPELVTARDAVGFRRRYPAPPIQTPEPPRPSVSFSRTASRTRLPRSTRPPS